MRLLKTLLLTLPLILATTAVSQNAKPIQIQRPVQTNPGVAQIDEVGLLRKDITKMRSELDDLKKQFDTVNKTLQGLQANQAHCKDHTTSVSSNGQRDCSPFACDKVTGMCLSSCNNSLDCAGNGTNCYMATGRCGK